MIVVLSQPIEDIISLPSRSHYCCYKVSCLSNCYSVVDNVCSLWHCWNLFVFWCFVVVTRFYFFNLLFLFISRKSPAIILINTTYSLICHSGMIVRPHATFHVFNSYFKFLSLSGIYSEFLCIFQFSSSLVRCNSPAINSVFDF